VGAFADLDAAWARSTPSSQLEGMR
jgi:hypothetical protein